MKLANRAIFVLSLLCAALLGGLLAAIFQPEPVNAAAALAFGPPVKHTAMQVPNIGIDGFNTSFTKIGDIGTFTVENAASLVEVTHQGRLFAENVVGVGVYFELRVDDQPPLANTGQAMVRSTEASSYPPITFSAYWQDLPAGEHTVSLWVRAITAGGTGDATMNPGGFASNDLLVKEFLPFGATHMPMIVR